MYPHHQGGQGQVPSHWQPPPPAHHQSSYPPPPSHMASTLPPPPPQEPRPDMAAHQHPQYQQQYRLPGPNEWNRGPPQDPYRQQPPPPPQYVAQHQPPAPRQRTAIACRYCRRRKIRCSGFEATEDGRCSNCMRFNQDCIFTPVSAQTQAFVPAHTVWRGVGQPPPMYGAYGQPLPPATQHAEPYAQPSAPPASQPYYTSQPPRQGSPPNAYRYEGSRASSSPHSQAPTTPGAAPAPYYNAPLQPPSQSGRSDGRTPPPAGQQGSGGNRPGMRINDLVSDNGSHRTSTDSDMLNMLNRRPV